jgi:hypothetical protein
MVATTKTRADLVSGAADNLGLTSSGNAAEAEDLAKIDGYVDALLAELQAMNIVYVADEGAIPVEWFNPLVDLLADDAAPAFGRPGRPVQEIEQIEMRLRIMVNNAPAANKYLQTDHALAPRRLWTLRNWQSGW